MTISAFSRYRGGTLEDVLPICRRLKAAYQRLDIGYRLSRFETGPDAGDWLVIVQYADQAAYERAQAAIEQDAECQRAFVEIARFAKRISRDVVVDIDL